MCVYCPSRQRPLICSRWSTHPPVQLPQAPATHAMVALPAKPAGHVAAHTLPATMPTPLHAFGTITLAGAAGIKLPGQAAERGEGEMLSNARDNRPWGSATATGAGGHCCAAHTGRVMWLCRRASHARARGSQQHARGAQALFSAGASLPVRMACATHSER